MARRMKMNAVEYLFELVKGITDALGIQENYEK
jgi:hypothetical protein